MGPNGFAPQPTPAPAQPAVPVGDPMQKNEGDVNAKPLTKELVNEQLQNYMEIKGRIISSLNAIKNKATQIPNTPEMTPAKNKLSKQFKEFQEALGHIDQAINFTNELMTLVK